MLQRAIEHVQRIGPALGIGAQAPEFGPDPHVLETSSGAKAANLQQRYRGVPIFQAALTVRFAPDGALVDTVGSSVTVGDERAVAPALTVQEAVARAAEHVSRPDAEDEAQQDEFGAPLPLPQVDVSGFEPKVRATFAGSPERHTVLEAGPFAADIPASLMWFPRDEGIALAWTMLLTMPEYGQYRVIVDAGSGEILFCHQTVRFVAAAGNVYRRNGAGSRQMTPFPRTLGDLGLVHPSIGQRDWRCLPEVRGAVLRRRCRPGRLPARRRARQRRQAASTGSCSTRRTPPAGTAGGGARSARGCSSRAMRRRASARPAAVTTDRQRQLQPDRRLAAHARPVELALVPQVRGVVVRGRLRGQHVPPAAGTRRPGAPTTPSRSTRRRSPAASRRIGWPGRRRAATPPMPTSATRARR